MRTKVQPGVPVAFLTGLSRLQSWGGTCCPISCRAHSFSLSGQAYPFQTPPVCTYGHPCRPASRRRPCQAWRGFQGVSGTRKVLQRLQPAFVTTWFFRRHSQVNQEQARRCPPALPSTPQITAPSCSRIHLS